MAYLQIWYLRSPEDEPMWLKWSPDTLIRVVLSDKDQICNLWHLAGDVSRQLYDAFLCTLYTLPHPLCCDAECFMWILSSLSWGMLIWACTDMGWHSHTHTHTCTLHSHQNGVLQNDHSTWTEERVVFFGKRVHRLWSEILWPPDCAFIRRKPVAKQRFHSSNTSWDAQVLRSF